MRINHTENYTTSCATWYMEPAKSGQPKPQTWVEVAPQMQPRNESHWVRGRGVRLERRRRPLEPSKIGINIVIMARILPPSKTARTKASTTQTSLKISSRSRKLGLEIEIEWPWTSVQKMKAATTARGTRRRRRSTWWGLTDISSCQVAMSSTWRCHAVRPVSNTKYCRAISRTLVLWCGKPPSHLNPAQSRVFRCQHWGICPWQQRLRPSFQQIFQLLRHCLGDVNRRASQEERNCQRRSWPAPPLPDPAPRFFQGAPL